MLKKLRNKKNEKGFTLVEVIVVAVIVAILAAVAVPLYQGYVDSSRQNVVQNTAGSLASFCAASRNSGTIPPDQAGLATGAVINGAQGTTWTVPNGVTVDIAAPTITVTHVDDNGVTASASF